MLKKIALVFILISTPLFPCLAQSNEDFINYEGDIMTKVDGAVYVKEECDGKSTCKARYLSGKKYYEINYNNGKKGKYISWYENGRIMEEGEYNVDGKYLIENFFDSTGKELITNGTGTFVQYYNSGRKRRIGEFKNGKQTGEWNYWFPDEQKKEQGSYVENEKDGEWKGWHESGNLYFSEIYQNGKLVKGQSFSEDSVSYDYTQLHVIGEYHGGMKGLIQDVTSGINNIGKYLKENEVNRMYIRIDVSKEGVVEAAYIAKGIHPKLDYKVLEIVKKLKWEPSLYRGQKVKRKFVLPIRFN